MAQLLVHIFKWYMRRMEKQHSDSETQADTDPEEQQHNEPQTQAKGFAAGAKERDEEKQSEK